jgi:hypothetical protein
MKRILILLLVALISFGADAQIKKRKGSPFRKSGYEPLYKWQGKYKRNGIHFSVGPTYLITKAGSEITERPFDAVSMTRISKTDKGHLGGFIEVGMLHIPKKKNKVVHYWDWALGVKHFGGQEDATESLVTNGVETIVTERNGKFFSGYAFGRMNIHNVIQVGNMDWIDNSLGFNVDYKVYGQSEQTGAVSLDQYNQKDLKIALNYAFGWGFKMRNGFFIMPQIRVPILGAYEWDGAKPTIRWFSSRYMPIMLTVKFGWLFKKDPNDCPPVYQHDSDKDKNDSFQQGGGM